MYTANQVEKGIERINSGVLEPLGSIIRIYYKYLLPPTVVIGGGLLVWHILYLWHYNYASMQAPSLQALCGMFLSLVLTALFYFSGATILACIEIQSEGKYGWAEKAPTWFRVTGFPARLYGLIMSGKPLTGYHLFMFIFPLWFFHQRFFHFQAPYIQWSGVDETLTIAMFFAWSPMWDYHWFALNPAYEGRFTRNDVWWHAKSYWVAGLFPIDYLSGAIVSIVFAFEAALLAHQWTILINHLIVLGLFIVMTLALKYFGAPLYQGWDAFMRRKDERHLVSIFHRE